MKKLFNGYTTMCLFHSLLSAAIDLDGKTFEAVGSEPISLSI